jgi:hypothetical protein
MGQSEALPQLLDLIGDRGRVAGVAGIDLDGDRTALTVGEQSVNDDRPPFLAIPIVTEAGQRAGVALIVAAADVVKDDGST